MNGIHHPVPVGNDHQATNLPPLPPPTREQTRQVAIPTTAGCVAANAATVTSKLDSPVSITARRTRPEQDAHRTDHTGRIAAAPPSAPTSTSVLSKASDRRSSKRLMSLSASTRSAARNNLDSPSGTVGDDYVGSGFSASNKTNAGARGSTGARLVTILGNKGGVAAAAASKRTTRELKIPSGHQATTSPAATSRPATPGDRGQGKDKGKNQGKGKGKGRETKGRVAAREGDAHGAEGSGTTSKGNNKSLPDLVFGDCVEKCVWGPKATPETQGPEAAPEAQDPAP